MPVLKTATLESCASSYKQPISSLEASCDGTNNDAMWANQDTIHANDALQAFTNTMTEEVLSQESNKPSTIDNGPDGSGSYSGGWLRSGPSPPSRNPTQTDPFDSCARFF